MSGSLEPGLLLAQAHARAWKRVEASEARRLAWCRQNIISQAVARVSRWQIQREAGVAALSSETRVGRVGR